MELGSIVEVVETVGFPIVVAGGVIWYTLKTSKDRELRAWDTIKGFQSVLHKFDDTLKDVSLGLKEVKLEVKEVRNEVDEVKKEMVDVRATNRKEG